MLARMAASARALVLRTEGALSPFGDPPRDGWFSGETVEQATVRALTAAGMTVESGLDPEQAAARLADGGPAMLLPDSVYLSEKAARDFDRAARRADRPVALALERDASVAWTEPLQPLRASDAATVVHDVLWIPGGDVPPPRADPKAWLRSFEAEPLEVRKRVLTVPVRVPTLDGATRNLLAYPVTSTVVVAVDHWVHLLWLNQIAFGIRWMELLRRRPLWGLWRAISALSFDRHRLLERMVWVGRGARIHPSARLSGTIVGEGARIEAGATVRNGFIGARAEVGAHATLLNTVVGDDAHVHEDATLVSCAVYPQASVGNLKLQVSLLGRGCLVNGWAGFVDAKFDGPIRVQHRGELRSTGRSFLGSVVGHDAQVAAKVLVMPGREIPNGATVVMRPDEVISRIPDDLEPGRPYVRHRGTLVPLGEERP